MQIIEHTPTRLVMRQRRLMMAVVFAAFTAMSLVFEINVLVQGIGRLGVLNPFQVLAWLVWLGLASLLTFFGAVIWLRALHGTVCIFDRAAETVTVRKTGLLRPREETHSIYAVSHLDVARNDDVRVFGVFLVLRPNARIPLTTVPPFEEAHVRQLARTVSQFIRGG